MPIPPTPTLPLTTGFHPSIASLEVQLDGQRYRVKSLEWNHGMDRGVVRSGVEPDGFTRGEYSVKTFNLEMIELMAATFIDALSARGAYMEVSFAVIWTLSEPAAGYTRKFRAEGCLVKEAGQTINGKEGIMRKIPCDVQRIYEEEKLPFTPWS